MRSVKTIRLLLLGLLLTSVALTGADARGPLGLKPGAYVQLDKAGVTKYLGHFAPASSTALGDGWTRYDYDTDGGNGPVCIAGTPYSIFTRPGNPSKLLIFEQGGGACWQDFYNCNVVVENNALPPFPQVDLAGIWNRSNPANPFADYSVVYMPYCDGSVFSGDNDVVDADFPFGPIASTGVCATSRPAWTWRRRSSPMRPRSPWRAPAPAAWAWRALRPSWPASSTGTSWICPCSTTRGLWR